MTSVTASTVGEAVSWINNTQHHIGRWEGGVFILQGYANRLRIRPRLHERIKFTMSADYPQRMYDAEEAV